MDRIPDCDDPGGEPWIINEVMQPKGNLPDRYPLNQNNAFVINVPLAYSFYLLPVFFPEAVWVGLAPFLFGFGQFVGHGIANNRKLKSMYNPGLAAVVLGHVPLGLWYLREVQIRGIITVWDWVFAIAYMAVFIVVGMLKIGYGILSDEDLRTRSRRRRWSGSNAGSALLESDAAARSTSQEAYSTLGVLLSLTRFGGHLPKGGYDVDHRSGSELDGCRSGQGAVAMF